MSFRGKKIFWILLVVVAVLDLASKSVAFELVQTAGKPSDLHYGQPAITVIPGFFYLTEVWNPGGIWGIAQTGFGSKLLVIFRIAAIPGLILLASRTPASERRLITALGLFCAGAVGNLYDNLRFEGRGVRDFLEFFLFGENGYRYPTFNIADSAIVCAAMLLFYDVLFGKRSEPAA